VTETRVRGNTARTLERWQIEVIRGLVEHHEASGDGEREPHLAKFSVREGLSFDHARTLDGSTPSAAKGEHASASGEAALRARAPNAVVRLQTLGNYEHVQR